MTEPILSVRDVTKRFAQITAVDRLTFSVTPGEIFALLGPNGAGKTTMVRMLMGIIRPDSGVVEFSGDGARRGTLPPHLLGYLPEDRGLYKGIPVIKILTFMGVVRGMERSSARRSAERWLERLELGDRSGEKLDALSKGNQQKIQFIASILHEPRFAVLDEPFAGLDPVNQDLFLDILRELRAAGTTVLLSAHQMQLVERLVDRVLLIHRGRDVLHGTIGEIKATAGISNRILLTLEGEPNIASFAELHAVERAELTPQGDVALYVRRGEPLSALLASLARAADVRAIHSEAISLHDIFVQQVGPGAAGPAEDEA